MAASSSSRRCLQLAIRSGSRRTLSTNPNPIPNPRFKANLVDTFQLVKNLESSGLSPEEAQCLSNCLMGVLNSSLNDFSGKFAPVTDLTNNVNIQEAIFKSVKSDCQSVKELLSVKAHTEISRTNAKFYEMMDGFNKARLYRNRVMNEEMEKVKANITTQFEELKSVVTKVGVGIILSVSAGFGLHFLSLKRGA